MSKTKSAGNGNERSQSEKPECFIIMPISDPEGYAPGHFRRVFEDMFAPACEQSGYRAVRPDQVRQTNLIHLDILQRLIESPMAICDLSSRNPNVLFELGLRQAFDKPVVLVQEAGTPPIFDIAPLRITTYRREMLYRDVLADQAELAGAIAATRDSAGDAKSVNSIVRLLGLTHAASLAAPAEGDETASLLRVIMNELSNVKSQVTALQTASAPREVYVPSSRRGGVGGLDQLTLINDLNVHHEALLLFNRFMEQGLVKGSIHSFHIPPLQVRRLINSSDSFEIFIRRLSTMVTVKEARNLDALFDYPNLRARLEAVFSEERDILLSKEGQLDSKCAEDEE